MKALSRVARVSGPIGSIVAFISAGIASLGGEYEKATFLLLLSAYVVGIDELAEKDRCRRAQAAALAALLTRINPTHKEKA